MRDGPNPYREVALTYVRPWSMRVLAGLVALYFLCLAVWPPMWRSDMQQGVAVVGVTMMAWVAALVAAHVKEQLADWRSAIVPNFRLPHLFVGAFILGIALVALCWFDARWLPMPTRPEDRPQFLGLLAL